MSQPMGEPTLGEVVRTLERFEQDVSRRLDELKAAFDRAVTADVYDAHRTAMNSRIDTALAEVAELRTELDAEKRERRADRRIIVAAALSLLVAVVGAALIAALGIQ